MPGNWNSGRRKQPTALAILRGNPGKRPLHADREPTPPPVDAAFDVPPPELAGDKRARAEWRRLVPMLRDCGLISQAERGALISLCQQWSTYLEARATVHDQGLTDAEGKPSAFLGIADRALTHCHRLWSEGHAVRPRESGAPPGRGRAAGE